MKKFLFLFLLAALSGCIQVDYTGKKFAPVDSVTHYVSLEEFHSRENQDDYLLIGKFTAIGGRKKHPFEIEEKVLEKSRQYGGDILCFTGKETRFHGHYDKSAQEFGAPDLKKRKISKEESGKFGSISPLTADREKSLRNVFHFHLYKKRAEVKRQLGQ